MKKSESITERWIGIDRYIGIYEVSNLGRVRSLDRIVYSTSNGRLTNYFKKGRILKPIQMGNYIGVQLSVNGVIESKYIHRLVLESFTDPGSWKDTVNHIDGVKDNNILQNLEWNTQKQNNLHSRRVLRNGVFREVVRINPNDKKDIKTYPTIREAMEDLKLKKHDSNISKYCKLKNDRTYKGYMWRYKEDYDNENVG